MMAAVLDSLSKGNPMATLATLRRYGSPAWRIGGALALLLAAACGPKVEDAKVAADSAATVPSDSSGMGDMAGMSMTGDPDRDFLRMMSDHHKGLIALAHETMEAGRGTAESRADARQLDTKQDKELERMVKLLESGYKDPYEPKVMPPDQAMVDSLMKETGMAYAMKFYQYVVVHHRRAIVMIDEYLPNARRPDVKDMAQAMRRDQLGEITEFERKAQAGGN